MRYVCAVAGMLLGSGIGWAIVYTLYPRGFGLAAFFSYLFALFIGLCVGLGMGLLLGTALGDYFFPGPQEQTLSDQIDLTELDTRLEDRNRGGGSSAENESIRGSQ